MDLLLNRDNTSPSFGDLVFTNSSCPTTEDFTDAVAQKVFILLRTFQDEWYLNTTTGVPYLQEILGKKAEKGVVDRIIQSKVLAEDGVAGIENFTSFLGGNRVYTANMVIRTTQGTTFRETLNIE